MSFDLGIRDELGGIPDWRPSRREGNPKWSVTTHFFASYAKRQTSLSGPGLLSIDPVRANDDLGNLVVVVNRYVPLRAEAPSPIHGGLTLVLAHCNGGHKEMWEPTITNLLGLDRRSSTTSLISEIWALEPVHHGDAAVLNKDSGMDVDPMQYPVDLIEFVERRLPISKVAKQDVPTLLPRHEVLHRPNVIAVGHSIGGSAVVHAALHAPKAFASLILIEPLLANPVTNVRRPYEVVSAAALKRKDVFDSQDAVIGYLRRHPAYKTWDHEIMLLFAKYALYENGKGELCLKAKKEHEAALHASRFIFEGLWYSLQSMSAELPIHFIYGTKSRLLPSWSKALTKRQPPNASACDVDAGHMVVEEKPALLAMTIFEYLKGKGGEEVKRDYKL